MYKILRVGVFWPRRRLLAADGIQAAEEYDQVARDLHSFVRRAHKMGFVSARQAVAGETVVTHWNGAETTNTAAPGDWIVANLDAAGVPLRDRAGNPNVYVIAAAKFPALYARAAGETEFGEIYGAVGEVDAIFLSGGFLIKAPWGEMQRADAGYLLRNGDEVYGNNQETFERTYKFNA